MLKTIFTILAWLFCIGTAVLLVYLAYLYYKEDIKEFIDKFLMILIK